MSEALTVTELKRHGVEVIPEIVWDERPTLRPGMDFRDGVTYFTVPAKVNEEVTVGRGKTASKKIVTVDALVAVTSDGRQFRFNPENVDTAGFAYPENVVIEKVRRWSSDSIQTFLRGNAQEPDPAILHSGIRRVYEEYIEFANEAYYDILPLYVMGSYMFRLFRSLGYIHFNGTAASGKSQNLLILDALGFNAMWSNNISPAALYRRIAGMPGIVLIDEAEGWEGERGEELRRILNAGYLDGSTVHRAEKGPNDMFIVKSFETFGPKAIASINPLDYVIGSRCLIVAMRPALRTIPEFDRDDPRWQRIRDRLYLWAMYHSAEVAKLVEQWNETTRHDRAPQLRGRQWQITQLYVVLADYIDQFDGGDRCARLIEFFNGYFADLQKQQDATDRIRIVLKCLPRVLAQHTPHDGGYFYLKTIHEVVTGYLEEDAKDYYKTRQLSKHLDVLGFKNKRSQRQGTQVWLDPEAIRQEFRQRRVEPYPEDAAWLAGEHEYAPAAPVTPAPPDDRTSIWDDLPEEPE